jgi:acetylornithine deacetylase/succinyl-diaminopimelate desuccinylase-like protein
MKPSHVFSSILAVLIIANGLGAESPARRSLDDALEDPRVQVALSRLDGNAGKMAADLAEIGAIPSPSGSEHERAAAVAAMMRRIGLSDVRVDEIPNAVGRIPGRSGRTLVFISTLDDLETVAEHQRRAGGPPRVEDDRVIGPGVNTSSITISMLAAAEAFVKSGIEPEHDLIFAAVAQEETGLTGMRKIYAETRDGALGFIDILGDGRSISYGAIGIHWWKVAASGPPGHSLGGGLPNVNQGIGRAVDRILSLPHPARETASRTVVNVGILRSGAVFNHKPENGWFSLDIRSLDMGVIAAVEEAVRAVLDEVSAETGIAFQMEPFQLTPGGQIPDAVNSPLVETAVAVSRHLGYEPRLGNAGSSNMNIAIGGGTPAIGLGGSRGGQRGFPDEWADIPAMVRSAKHVFLLAAALGGAANPGLPNARFSSGRPSR